MNEIEKLEENVRDLKVLFVDDEEAIREGTTTILKKFFDDVVVCTDGVDGLEEFLKAKDFDIVITDIMMPKMDGISMVKKIKEINNDIFTIFITASRSGLANHQELSDVLLKKPISFEDIIMIMKKVENLKSKKN
ncbi:MAG: CheY-like chemotaxis protein [Sulfurimonas sp.]|jgi:CheY-like chemotaxis protein